MLTNTVSCMCHRLHQKSYYTTIGLGLREEKIEKKNQAGYCNREDVSKHVICPWDFRWGTSVRESLNEPANRLAAPLNAREETGQNFHSALRGKLAREVESMRLQGSRRALPESG